MLQLELLLLLPSTELFVTGARNTPSMRLHPLSISTLSKRRRNYSLSFPTRLSHLLLNTLNKKMPVLVYSMSMIFFSGHFKEPFSYEVPETVSKKVSFCTCFYCAHQINISSRVSHFYTFFELSYTLVTTQAHGL